MNRVQYFLDLANSDKPLSEEDKVELQQLIIDLRNKYDEGTPIISDFEYDILEELAIYEGEIRSSSELNNYGERVQHPIDVMRGTLNKIYYLSDDEHRTNKSRKSLQEWIHTTQEALSPYGINLLNEKIIVTAKYDGMSCCLYVDDSGKCLWLTRGDTGTNEGVDIGHVMNGMNISKVPGDATQFELMISNDMLQELNERYSTNYKNTRALTAGVIRTKEVDYRAQFIMPIPLKLYRKGVLTIHPEQLTKYPHLICTLKDIDKIRQFADNNRHVFGKFRTDGVVITIMNPNVQKILGRKDNINQFEVAYKFTEEATYSQVQEIHFQVSDMGVITPVLEIDPVVMKGNTISRVSLHNKSKFDELGLRYNDTVKILYDIIPYCILDDYCNTRNEGNHNIRISFPTECPECGKKLDLSNIIVGCDNPQCPAIRIGRIINYLDNLQCKGIGPETVHRLCDIGVITDIPSLYRIGSTKQMRVIMDSHGFGQLKMKMILTWIRKISTLKDYEFFGALGFKGLNKQFFKIIFNDYDINDFLSDISNKKWDVILSRVSNLHGIGDKKAMLLIKGLKADRHMIELCMKRITITSTLNSNSNDIMGVVFTGFRDQYLADILTKQGYTVQDNITKNTALVVVKDSAFTSGTTNKAKQRGIKIMTKNEIMKGS